MSFSILSLKSSFGVNLIEDSYVCAAAQGNEIEAAIIEGYVGVAAPEYVNETDVAIMRYSAPSVGIEDGYYRFTVQSLREISEVGYHDAVTRLRDVDGKVIYEWHPKIEVFSLTLPERGPNRAIIELHSITNHEADGRVEFAGWRAEVCCDNGTCGTCVCNGNPCPSPVG